MTEKPSPRCPCGWRAIILSAFGLAVMIQAGAVMMQAGAVMMGGAALAQTPQDILLYSGPDREQKLLEGARKEGQVVIYAALIQNQAMRPIAEGFARKYPFVKLTTWRADSEDIVQKAAAEVRANNNVADVIEGTGAGEEAVEANIARPFYAPAIAGFPEPYRNAAGLWAPTRLSYYGIAYNTKMVPPDQVPKNYDDLLDPRWKGKMAWRIGSSTGTPLFLTNLRLAWGEPNAMAYFDKLKDQKIVNFGAGSARTLVDRVIAGEYAIALNIFAHHPLISKGKGAPVSSQLMDPVATTAATMSVVKGLHHPYAAMLLVDYILSKEGQGILARAEYFPVDPQVAPLPLLAPVVPRIAGMGENFVGPDKLIKYTDSSEEIFQKLFR
jgi:ABC-type Fe3+ transport system substrate-binding protein